MFKAPRSEGTMVKLTHLVLTALFALSACDQAPDDDNSRASASGASEKGRSGTDPREELSRSRRSALPLSYELRGLPGTPRPFATKETCEAARKVVIEAQAKEDKRLGDQGVLFPNRQPLVCFPLSPLDNAGALRPSGRG
jgi:hypothetical protein